MEPCLFYTLSRSLSLSLSLPLSRPSPPPCHLSLTHKLTSLLASTCMHIHSLNLPSLPFLPSLIRTHFPDYKKSADVWHPTHIGVYDIHITTWHIDVPYGIEHTHAHTHTHPFPDHPRNGQIRRKRKSGGGSPQSHTQTRNLQSPANKNLGVCIL